MPFQKAKALQDAEKSVAQGKISQAVKQYQEILDNDPADVSLFNTIGDLYVRDRNIAEGLKQFHKLAEAYSRDGFNVKAIAIYRKISKVDPNSVDTLVKLGELYQLQGLSREAREQYLQATEFFKKRNQTDRALEVLRKLLPLDPENINFRNRLAAEYEQAGKREDAAQTHLGSAEILLRRDDQVAAETALKKAAELDPKNSKIQILRASMAIARHDLEEAERIVNSSPELQSDPAGKRLLLDAYLGARKLPEAEKLVREVLHDNPTDFGPVSSVSALLVENGDIEEAYQLLLSVADLVIGHNNAAPLLEALRQIWNKAPKHIPTLELIHRICERTANEVTLPEVLEALGRAYEEAGDMEKAEDAYLKLVDREPENENYHGLLNAVQQKLGREVKPVEFPARQMARETEEEEPRPEMAGVDVDQEAMVKEALENSDLFARYNLPEKAIGELEKALEVYPDQIELHRRILEISRKGFPERGAIAAAQLARIFTDQGDHETASKYYAIASAKGSMEELPLPPAPPSKKVEEPLPPPPALPEVPEAGTTREFTIPVIASEEPTAAETAAPPPSPEPASFELTPPEASSEPPDAPLPPPPAALAEEPLEMDLSGDLAAMSSLGFQAPAASVPEPLLPPPVDMPAPLEIPVLPEEPAAAPIIVQEAAPVMEAPAESPTEPPAAAPLESPTEVPELLPAAVEEVIPADFEDSRIEVEFYLENGFIDEARQSVALLEEKYPGSSFVAELRQRLDDRAGEAPPAEPQTQVAPEDKRVVAEPLAEAELADEARLAEQPASAVPAEEAVAELPIEIVPSEPEVASPPEPAPVEEESAPEEWELPTSYADTPQPEPATDLVVPPPAMVPEAPPQVAEFATPPPVHEPAAEESAAVGSGGMDILGDLAVDFASSIDGLATSADAMQAALGASPTAAATPPSDPTQGVAQLHGLLAEMEEPGAAAAAKGDPETHYNLGVAFREMGLLDEAIGEFQKVVKGAGKGNLPTNFLQACSLLAICFMDKKMPAIAVKWYLRALETPALDEEALMALQYDLGLAYEQAGDSHSALERFIEVYSQNIDFRDVAEKIRELQQKA